MKTAQGKTVSIFTGDPPTENGPCAASAEEDINGDSVHEVAAKVVENVVRLASEATQGNSPHSSSVDLPQETTAKAQQQRPSTESRGPCLMRLPTIQIDTVPSMPPSPDWSPPPEENFFQEEVLDEDEIEIQFVAPTEEAFEEIKKFATSYVQDLISKAMTIAEQKQTSEDTANAQDVAAQLVDEVIAKATEAANEKLERSPVVTISLETLEFPSVPSIQIDTVASMPPSPTESDEEDDIREQGEPQMEIDRELPKIKFRMKVDDEDKITPAPVKFSQAPEEMKEFAASYVKDIISKAVSMAEEKFVPTVPFNFEDVNLMKSSGPWYIRAREALMRLLRTACFCTPRRNES